MANEEVQIGATLDGRYLLRREIARGGMCVVLEAEHAYTGRIVAIKALNEDHEHKDAARLRLLREAKVLELSRHPNVVEVLDASVTPTGIPFVVMEMLEGRTLSGILAARQQLPIADTLSIARQISSALAYAHARGVVHRDIKPSNLILVRDQTGAEVIKIIDFSIAALAGPAISPRDPKITKLGEIVGTPEYMAPEQLLLRDDVDHRCDVYAVAVTVFECLAGAVPFSGDFGDVILKVNTLPAPSVRALRHDVDERLAAVLQRGLAREAGDRFADMLAFQRALVEAGGTRMGGTTLLAGPPPAQPPPLPLTSSLETIPGPPPASVIQRRRYVRQPYVTPVRMMIGGVHFDGRSEDISEGGLLVVVDRACPNAQQAEVRFALPLSGRIVRVQAMTRWVKGARGKAAAGLEFAAISDDVRKEVAQYVSLMGQMKNP